KLINGRFRNFRLPTSRAETRLAPLLSPEKQLPRPLRRPFPSRSGVGPATAPMTDIATRVYNHTWKIDPIVRSVLDTDFYKLLMAQTIFRRHRDDEVTFGILNRTTSVKLAQLVDIGELKEQLDHIRTLSLSRGESTWLRGNMFYGKRQMFAPDFIAWLEAFRFPAYHLERKGDQYELTFEGPWIETTMWEIPALA